MKSDNSQNSQKSAAQSTQSIEKQVENKSNVFQKKE